MAEEKAPGSDGGRDCSRAERERSIALNSAAKIAEEAANAEEIANQPGQAELRTGLDF